MCNLKDVRDLCVAVSSICIPLLGLYVGNNFTESIKDKEIKLKTVELAVAILQQKPQKDSQDNRRVRGWAIEVLNEYSGVPITEDKYDAFETYQIPLLKGWDVGPIYPDSKLGWGGLTIPRTEKDEEKAAD